MLRLTTLIIFSALLESGNAQNIVVASARGPINLAPNQALVTFVPTPSDTVEGAIRDTTLSTAQDQAVAATLVRAVPIPIIGPLAAPLIGPMMARLHPKTVTGFSIAFLKGLNATTLVAPGKASFEIPTEYLEGVTPSLLRVKPSAKDSTRIIRSLHLSVKASGRSVTPDAHNAKVLGTEEDLVASHTEVRDATTILISESPLPSGEYAVALVPTAGVMAPVGKIWDFRVEARAETHAVATPAAAPPAAAASETHSIELGQNPARVIASFGNPEKIVKLGAKEIYYYKDLKVIFVNGKVADVQ
jgi:hypothetical protein